MKRLAFAAASVLAAAALAACTSETSTSPSAASISATRATGTTGTLASSTAPPDEVDGAALTTRLSEAILAARSGRMTSTMSAVGPTESAPASSAPVGATASPGPTAASAAAGRSGTISSEFVVNAAGTMDTHVMLTLGGTNIEAILVGGAMYVKMAGLSSTDGKPWIKLDPSGNDALSRQLAGTIAEAGDPRSQLRSYSGATVTLVERSGGVSRYRLTGVAGAGSADVLITMDDATGRPTRTTVEGGGIQAVAEFTDWGAPVTVSAPPADQVGPPPGS